MTTGRAIVVASLLAAPLALGRCSPPPAALVERLEVAIHLSPNGDADVHESIALRVKAPTTFERVVRPARAESLAFVAASLDGAPVTGAGGGPGGALRVAWPLHEPGDRVRTLDLRYRASGVLAIRGRRGDFAWSALPSGRRYVIGNARLVVTVPAGTVRVGEWGVAEPDWAVVELPDGIAATRADLGPDIEATLLAGVAVDPASMVEPRWQHEAELGKQLVLAFIAGGAFILVIGVGIVWIIWFEAVTVARDRSWRQSVPPGTSHGLFASGIVCLAFGALVTLIAFLASGRYGHWAFAIPASILMVGFLFLIVGWMARGRPLDGYNAGGTPRR